MIKNKIVVTPEDQLFELDQEILELVEKRMLLCEQFPEEAKNMLRRDADKRCNRLMRSHKISGLSKTTYRALSYMLTSCEKHALKQADEW
jgi:hypothetical protein